MSWTKDDQAKLDLLRGKELAGTLTGPEHTELAGLMARVEAEETVALTPEMARLRDEVAGTADELRRIEAENEELARLMAQQQAAYGLSILHISEASVAISPPARE
jgi:hypothetical protein